MEHVAKRLLVSALWFSAACADDGNDGRVLDDQGSGSRVDQVEGALSAPTGTVDQNSAVTVEANAEAFAGARAAFDAVLFVRAPGAEACRQGSDEDATYDLACASSGRLSGRLSVQGDAGVEGSAAGALLTVSLENVCALDHCVDATGEMRVFAAPTGASATVALEATVRSGGASVSLAMGAKGVIGNGALDAAVVYFDSAGRSYVVEATVGVEGLGAYTVRGANGTFDCAVVLDRRACTPQGGAGAAIDL